VIIHIDRGMMRLAVVENDAERRYQAALVDTLGNIVSVFRPAPGGGHQAAAGVAAGHGLCAYETSIMLNEEKWCAVDLLNAALWCSLVALYAWLARSYASEGSQTAPDRQCLHGVPVHPAGRRRHQRHWVL
jgi:ATP-binding cassette, subfamily B, bacterial